MIASHMRWQRVFNGYYSIITVPVGFLREGERLLVVVPKTGNIVVILRVVILLIFGEKRWEKKGPRVVVA